MGTWMWSVRRNAWSFLYSLEEGLLSPNVKLTSHRWWASWLWKTTLASYEYSKEFCSKFSKFTVYIPQSFHWSVVVVQVGDQESDCKSPYCPEYSATDALKYSLSTGATHNMTDGNIHMFWDLPVHCPVDLQNFRVGKKQLLR